jgi:hypothetical protein
MRAVLSCSFQQIGQNVAYAHNWRAVEVCQAHTAIFLIWNFSYKTTDLVIYVSCTDCGVAVPQKTHIC